MKPFLVSKMIFSWKLWCYNDIILPVFYIFMMFTKNAKFNVILRATSLKKITFLLVPWLKTEWSCNLASVRGSAVS